MSGWDAALRRLADLGEAGWTFLSITDDSGELVELRGVRAWPGGYADALRVAYVTDAAGLRCDHTGGLVWQREGGLTEVVDGLLSLPAPWVFGAPRRVSGRATDDRWYGWSR